MNTQRKIIEIDEERCNGCGQCVLDCAEGAIRIIDGKAKVISDNLCDGLGACIGGCPQDALHIVERLAPPFDEKAVHAHLEQLNPAPSPLACGCSGSLAQQLHQPLPSDSPKNMPDSGTMVSRRGCPSSIPLNLAQPNSHGAHDAQLPAEATASAGHWPIKLRLMPASAPFLAGAHLLLAADCAPAVCQNFARLARGKVVLISCPKFEDTDALAQKLTEICVTQKPSRITVLRMEVPCCQRLAQWVNEAVARASEHSDQPVPVTQLCLGREGQLVGID